MAYELSPVDLKVIHVKTTEELLERIPIMDGAIYLCTDTGNLYYDVNEERKKMFAHEIEQIKSDIDRIKAKEFINKYLVWYTYSDSGEDEPEEDDPIPEELDDYLFWYLYEN